MLLCSSSGKLLHRRDIILFFISLFARRSLTALSKRRRRSLTLSRCLNDAKKDALTQLRMLLPCLLYDIWSYSWQFLLTYSKPTQGFLSSYSFENSLYDLKHFFLLTLYVPARQKYSNHLLA